MVWVELCKNSVLYNIGWMDVSYIRFNKFHQEPIWFPIKENTTKQKQKQKQKNPPPKNA